MTDSRITDHTDDAGFIEAERRIRENFEARFTPEGIVALHAAEAGLAKRSLEVSEWLRADDLEDMQRLLFGGP